MSLPPPAGYGMYSIAFQAAGGGIPQYITTGFRNSAGQSAAACRASLFTCFTTAGGIFIPANYITGANVVEDYCLVNNGGALTSDVATHSVAGTGGWAAPSPAISVVARKRTALAGRQYRGRNALPSYLLDEADINSNGVIGAQLTHINTGLNTTLVGMTSVSCPMHLLHGPNLAGVTPLPTPVTSYTADNLVGTQRRRQSR